jgi:methylated-DNA-[protein]-cysteine S-methyltransferase
MRCRDVEEMWDEVRGDCTADLKEAVQIHLHACDDCQHIYEEYEGVAFCLSCLPPPEPSCDLSKKVVEHIAKIKRAQRATPVVLSAVQTPIGRLYVGFKEEKIAYVGIDTGLDFETVRQRVEARLRRHVVAGEAPQWLSKTLEEYFSTYRVDDTVVDIEDLTPFEQAALRAAAQIPPGEVRSYSWVASQIGRPRAARAVGQVMARNPLPLLFPCHRVVDSSGDLHNYGYGLEMKARLLKMEGYSARKL